MRCLPTVSKQVSKQVVAVSRMKYAQTRQTDYRCYWTKETFEDSDVD